MELHPRLIDVHVPPQPTGVVLILHGGASRRRRMMVSPTQLSVLRLVPLARRISAVGGDEMAVFRLLNSRRGWDTRHTPVRDANWALDEIFDRVGGTVATCLVGHSLGGRAAILAAPRPEVVSAVALAPWVYPTDVPPGIEGKRLLIVHGSRDRVASPRASAALAERLARRAATSFVLIHGATHAMLKRHGFFSGLAAGFATQSLSQSHGNNLPRDLGPGGQIPGVLSEVARGKLFVDVR